MLRTSLLVLMGACCLLPAGAAASTVELVKVAERPAEPGGKGVGGGPPLDLLELRVTGTAGDERVFVDGLTVRSPDGLVAGERCRSDAAGSVVCDKGEDTPARGTRVQSVLVALGDGIDRAGVANPPAVAIVRGGAGADVLEATGPSVPGVQMTWDGGPGPDVVEGGAGWAVTYADRTAPVAVTLDGSAGDGEAGEGDDVGAAARALVGGSGDDRLRGGETPVTLAGGAGADRLEAVGSASARRDVASLGGAPRDVHAELLGGPGDDEMLGGGGADVVFGEAGADRLSGGGGDDTLEGDAGADRVDGGAGDDVLALQRLGDRDPDLLAGGPGRDLVEWELGGPGRPRFRVTLDGRGPDGPIGEPDALAGDVEDVSLDAGTSVVVGDGRANRLRVYGDGFVDGRGGDDEIRVNDGLEGDARVDAGAGRDRIASGNGSRLVTRDGDRDVIECSGVLRDLRGDVGTDVVRGCVAGVVVDGGVTSRLRRPRPGGAVIVPLQCVDPYRACRVRVRFVLTRPGSRRGRELAVRSAVVRRNLDYRLRLPRDVPRGLRYIRVLTANQAPFRGAPPGRARGSIPIRVRSAATGG